MLLRLLKQDIRSTARIMVVLYAAVLVLGAVSRLLSSFVDETVGSILIMVFSRFITILFIIAVVACVVMSFVLMVIRFYKNFLTDEGYLMFTLPVTTGQLIWSKLLVSVFWVIVSAAVGVLTAFIMSVGTDAQDIIFDIDFKALFEGFTGGQTTAVIIMFVALLLFYAAYIYLRCYAAMAIGQSFGNHKLLLSVAFYIGFGIVEEIISIAILSPLLTTDKLNDIFMNAEPFSVVASFFGALDGYYLVLCVAYFVVTYLFFRKKLNLQ